MLELKLQQILLVLFVSLVASVSLAQQDACVQLYEVNGGAPTQCVALESDISTCFQVYRVNTVGASDMDSAFWYGGGENPVWLFSNIRRINFGERVDSLVALARRQDDGLAFVLNAGLGLQWERQFGHTTPGMLWQDNGFAAAVASAQPGMAPYADSTPAYGRLVAACDTTFGFSPVFSFGIQGERIAEDPGTEHFRCAESYMVLGGVRPELRPQLGPRLPAAMRAHAAESGDQPQAIQMEVSNRARNRTNEILSADVQRARSLTADISAQIELCEEMYSGQFPPLQLN